MSSNPLPSLADLNVEIRATGHADGCLANWTDVERAAARIIRRNYASGSAISHDSQPWLHALQTARDVLQFLARKDGGHNSQPPADD